MAGLPKSGLVSDQVDIYLHEGMIAEAMGAVGKESWSYTTLERVVKATLTSHPDWAIKRSRAQAESIMDAGKANLYHHAAHWLGYAREAYLQAGREAEWRAYLGELLDRHQRKHKLVPMLKALGK